MIMAVTPEQRKAALDLLLPYQRSDFEGIFRAMDGLPVTIRLLDPPLHEFLPEGDLEHIVSELTSQTGMKEEEIFSRIEKLSEVNPMLGFRGCRFVPFLVLMMLLLKYNIKIMNVCSANNLSFLRSLVMIWYKSFPDQAL